MFHAIQAWITQNPEYEYHFLDDTEARTYIAQHFPEALSTYDCLVPGAFKADLLRYCLMYNEGGVYVDSSMVPLVPLKEIVRSQDELVLVNDIGIPGGLYNAFMASKPQHPVFKKVIELVISRVTNREYGPLSLWPTGPVALGDAFKDLYSTPRAKWTRYVNNTFEVSFPPTIRLLNRETPKLWWLANKLGLFSERLGVIKNEADQTLILTKYAGYTLERKKTLGQEVDYSTLWLQRKVYAC
jgi:glycosyl transferase-like sugar-binding protein